MAESTNNQLAPTFAHDSTTRHHYSPDAHFLDHIVNPPPQPASQRNDSPCFESYFEDAFPASSPTPPSTFLDNILNPAEPESLPFGYSRLRETYSPAHYFNPSMPSARPPRLPNGYVDLTSDSEPQEQPQPSSKRHSTTPGPSSKRLKREDGTAARRTKTPEATKIEEIDLSDDKSDIQEILQKQRAEAVKAQERPEEKATNFNNFTCVICMDAPTDLTATSCGHLFCHTCLMEALIAGENRSGPHEPKRSQCPVCRKIINRTKPTDVIPLLLKKGLATQPRKSSVAPAPKST